MIATLVTTGLLCIMTAIVGGGVRAFGAEMPVLGSTKRQFLLGAFGTLLLAIVARQHLSAPTPPSATVVGSGSSADAPAVPGDNVMAPHIAHDTEPAAPGRKDAKPDVRPSPSSDKHTNKAETLRDQARADESANLLAKAASEYEAAYYSDGSQPSLGLKAANIYAGLNDFPDAASVMRVVYYSSDQNAANQASQWLTASQSGLQKISVQLTTRADQLVAGDLLWKATSDQRQQALDDYRLAVKANPQCNTNGQQEYVPCIWMSLLRMEAFAGDVNAVKRDLGSGATWNLEIYPRSFQYLVPTGDGGVAMVYDYAWPI